ncbi:kynureninase [Acinetobacter lwoffii]|uniref:kynureninase n=1 Tax=Acinetobacter lwoffii TaxID=28090 RepID=UPI003F8D7713
MKNIILISVLPLILIGCGNPNSKPTYGDYGLPKNCRALIQANIDGWRSKQYTAEEAMNSIERNCGANGKNWDN